MRTYDRRPRHELLQHHRPSPQAVEQEEVDQVRDRDQDQEEAQAHERGDHPSVLVSEAGEDPHDEAGEQQKEWEVEQQEEKAEPDDDPHGPDA